MISDNNLEIYGGIDPRTIAVYPISHAARYLGIAPTTLRGWVFGRTSPRGGQLAFLSPLILLPEQGKPLLSFHNLVEAHVLRALRTQHKVSMSSIRRALEYAEEKLGIERLLLDERLCAAAGELFTEKLGELINLSRSGQLAMREILNIFLERIERDVDGRALRLYPLLPGYRESSPRIVVIDPRISFGRPSVNNYGVSTAILAERYDCGEEVESLASDYGIPKGEVLTAIQYEALAA